MINRVKALCTNPHIAATKMQELIDCFSMREAAAAQLALLREQPDIFGPVMEDNRKRAQAAAAAAGMQFGQ